MSLIMPENVRNTLDSLAVKYVKGHYVEDGAAALEIIKPHLTPGVTAASGNSQTLRQTGIFEYLATEQHPAQFINQFVPGLSFEENRRLKKLGLSSDLYLSSANAITEDGKLCFLDGGGNRVAAILFGPEKVFIVVGQNKIVKNEKAAWERIQHYVSPQTAIQLGRKLPCAADGKCHNCNEPARFCRYYVTVNGQLERDKDRIEVIIVAQDLGI